MVTSTRSGFVALAGRPNVGKSTLVNAIVGKKVAIVSDKPQTTRRAIRGVSTTADTQLVMVDLPGVQRPRDELTRRMQRRVELELRDCDAALMVVNGFEGIGPGDRYIADALREASTPTVIAVNKIDRLNRSQTLEILLATAALEVGDDIFPVSAKAGTGVTELIEHLGGFMSEGPFFFPIEDSSDQPLEIHLAELVREQVLRRTFQEVPHSVEVKLDGFDQSKDDLTVLRALVWVETNSQKGILIGSGGAMIKQVGTAARRELERELGTRVHLDLAVRVKRGWRGDERALDRLGIE